MPERNLDLALQLRVEPYRGADAEDTLLLVEHEDDGTVGIEDPADVAEQVVEELVHRLRGQARLQDRLELVEAAARVLGAPASILLTLVQPRPLQGLSALLQEHVDQGAGLVAQGPARAPRS